MFYRLRIMANILVFSLNERRVEFLSVFTQRAVVKVKNIYFFVLMQRAISEKYVQQLCMRMVNCRCFTTYEHTFRMVDRCIYACVLYDQISSRYLRFRDSNSSFEITPLS